MCGNICFTTDRKKITTLNWHQNRGIVNISWEIKRRFTEGSPGNGFKTDQKSHNIPNLLNDLFHSSWNENTKDFFSFLFSDFVWPNCEKRFKEFFFFFLLKKSNSSRRPWDASIQGILYRDMIETNGRTFCIMMEFHANAINFFCPLLASLLQIFVFDVSWHYQIFIAQEAHKNSVKCISLIG